MSTDDIARIAAGLTEAQRADLAGDEWYLASCDGCGWYGSSQECGTDPSWCDDSNVYCPRCHKSGAGSGRFAEKYGDTVCRYLQEQAQ